MANETIYRAYKGNIVSMLWAIIPLQAMIAFGIYGLLKHSSALIGGVIVFSFFVWTLRVITSMVVLGEPVTLGKFVSIGLVFAAILVDKLGLFG